MTAADRELSFSSAFKTLKISSRGSGTLTNSSRTVTIAHNLGYVPFFMVHTQIDPSVGSASLVGDSTDYFISPFRLGTAVDLFEAENTHDIIAWADSTNLYVKARENVGVDNYPVYVVTAVSEDEVRAFESDAGYIYGSWFVGRDVPVLNTLFGAVRFDQGIALNQSETVVSAQLNLYVGERLGSSEVRMRVYGIDEDNTDDFNTGSPGTGRPRTTAYTDSNTTAVLGNTVGVNVKSQVEEIAARGGWSSGNAMGFIMEDNGTGDDNYYGETAFDASSYLSIIRSSTLASFKYTIFLNQLE